MPKIKGVSRKLGELLIREEMITREQLDEALKQKQSTGRFLGEMLVSLEYISEDELIGFLVRQCRIPHLKLSNFHVSPEVAGLIPAAICEEHKLLPIDRLGTLLTVAMVNPVDVEALEKIKKTVKLRIKPILCSWHDFNTLYEKIYGPEQSKIRRTYDDIPELTDDIDGFSGEGTTTSKKTPSTPKKQPEEEKEDAPRADGLIERFTFDTYVVAEANSFTYALAKSVAEAPGEEYNPLFIYGNTGLGKTHLSNAIGNRIVQDNGNARLVYIPTTRFIDDMLHAIEDEQMKQFREHYASVDVLILDDIQFLSGRTRVQQEFFNIFNDIHNRKKQIVLISDVPPKELEGLEKRLISRFEGGVVSCLEAPDFQTRLTILRQRTDSAGADVPKDVLKLLAESNQSNIRELEGALKKLLAYSSLVGHDITVELAQEILKHMFKRRGS
ncbi:MAG: ATP-binding protein [Candidatus Abyssubacteria bacterium]|nr:ATP-binding protein [Candidatus Abyssubacteria bacterium]